MPKTTVSNHTPDSLVKHFDAILNQGSHFFAHSGDGPIHLIPIPEHTGVDRCERALNLLLSGGRLERFNPIHSSLSGTVIGFLALRSTDPGRPVGSNLQGGRGGPVPAA